MNRPLVLLNPDIRGCSVESKIEMKIPDLAHSAVSLLIVCDTDYAKCALADILHAQNKFKPFNRSERNTVAKHWITRKLPSKNNARKPKNHQYAPLMPTLQFLFAACFGAEEQARSAVRTLPLTAVVRHSASGTPLTTQARVQKLNICRYKEFILAFLVSACSRSPLSDTITLKR